MVVITRGSDKVIRNTALGLSSYESYTRTRHCFALYSPRQIRHISGHHWIPLFHESRDDLYSLKPRCLRASAQTGGVAMRRNELMGPDLLSEIVIAMSGAVLFFFLMLMVVAALVAKF